MSGASVGVSVQSALCCWFTVQGSRPGAHLPTATGWGKGGIWHRTGLRQFALVWGRPCPLAQTLALVSAQFPSISALYSI